MIGGRRCYDRILPMVAALACLTLVLGEDINYPERAGEQSGYLEQPHISLSSDATFDAATAGVGHPESNRCSDVDQTLFTKGMECGPPLSLPCFDHNRCSSLENTGIYVFDEDCSLSTTSDLLAGPDGQKVAGIRMNRDHVAWELRNAAKEAGILAETYETACIFIHIDVGREWPCAVDQPLWNGGSNHLMLDMTDDGRCDDMKAVHHKATLSLSSR